MSVRHTFVCAALLILVAVPMSMAATIEVSGNTALTANSEYDRNPSLTYDGTDYWLFWTKGDDTSTSGVRGGTYNPDADAYVVYYKKAGTIAGLASAVETQLAFSSSARPVGFDQRVVSATYFGGKVYAFVSSGQSGTDKGLYYYDWNGSTWSGPTTLIADATAQGGHVNVTSDASYIYIVWEATADASSDCYTWDGMTLSSKIDISNDNQPKITLAGTTLYVVSIEDITTDIEVYSAAAGASPSFSSHSTAISAAGFYDPCIASDGTDLYVVTAPYEGGNDQQYLVQTKYSGGSWATVKRICLGGYGGTYWWDYWPVAYNDGGAIYVFFTTESASPSYSDAEIAYFELDWDLSNDHYFYVQNAVDQAITGDDISIAAGTYTEQVHVTTADLTLTGAGVDQTVIESPALLSAYFTSGTNDNYPVVFIDGVTGIDLADMTVDGDGQGNANPRFVGVGFWNGDGSLTDMKVLNVMETPFSGAQHGVGVYSYNDGGGPYSIDMTDVLVDDYQKTAVALLGDNLTVALTRVTTTGAGDTGVTAQNGIQTGYGSGGTITDCTVTGNSYTGASWTASGLLPIDGASLTVDGIALDGNQTSIYWINTNGSIDGATVDNPTGDAMYAHDDGARAPFGDRPQASPFDAELGGGSRGTTTVSLSNSRITGADAVDSWGPTNYAVGDVEFTITGCDISHWDYGIAVYEAGGTATTFANGNSIHDNGTYGFWTNSTARAVQDATMNYWGDPSGPYHSTNPSGTGDPVSDNVDFDPWLAGNVVCDPDPLELNSGTSTKTVDVDYLGGASGLVFGVSVTFQWDSSKVTMNSISEGDLFEGLPSRFFVTGSGNSRTVDYVLLSSSQPGVPGPGKLFSVNFTGAGCGTSDITFTSVLFRDNANNTLSGVYAQNGEIAVDLAVPTVSVTLDNETNPDFDNFAKNLDDLELEATIGDGCGDVDDVVVTADLSTLLSGGGSTVAPDTYAGGVATWDLDGVTLTGDGLKTITVSAEDLLGNVGTGNATVTVDNTAPGTVTGFAAAPAHEEVDLSWDNPSGLDTNYYGVVVRYDAWGNYPQYATSAPGYPADETSGDGEAYNQTGVVTGGTHGIVPRDIHYYSAFVYDKAFNYGGVTSAGQDRATNYWLGDVVLSNGNPGYDGYVGDSRILILSGTYGESYGSSWFDPECDVGPTDDNSRLGIPEPDSLVEFEDLMIFAMNYGVVSPLLAPVLPDLELSGSELALVLLERSVSPEGEFEVALTLEGNVDEVKGLSTEILFDAAEADFVSARLSDEMGTPVVPVFFWHGAGESSVELDLAVLGTGVALGGSGDVAVLTFRALGEEHTLEFGKTALRGAGNEVLDVELEGYESKPDLPVVFRLAGNAPNPFNPVTKVRYHVPHESEVSIRIYDVAGREVLTLLDGVAEAGRHEAVWDGRDAHGEAVGSGVYFCVMEAEGFHDSHKMTLLK